MSDQPLRYVEAAVTQQEVPDEVCLTISVSNCPHRCHGCHSPYLRKEVGHLLLPAIDALIDPYDGLITCVCLMGEGRNPHELETLLRRVRRRGQRTCLYSGANTAKPFKNLLPLLDYIKLGEYREEAGGLDSPATNQRFYRVSGEMLTDITERFQRKKDSP